MLKYTHILKPQMFFVRASMTVHIYHLLTCNFFWKFIWKL